MKKELEDIFTGLLFGTVLYLLGAIDFENYFSYPVIFFVLILIVLPIYNIVKGINKSS